MEKFFFSKNQSGNYSITVDFEKYSKVIKMVEKIQDTEGAFSNAISTSFTTTAESLQKVNGLSNIKLIYSEKLSHFTLSFDFRDLKSLNKAISHIGEYFGNTDAVQLFRSKLVRKLPNFINLFAQLQKKIINLKESFGIKYFLKNLKVISIYEFQDHKIRNPTSGFSKVSKDFQTIVYEDFLLDMKTVDFIHTVFLKKVSKNAKNILLHKL